MDDGRRHEPGARRGRAEAGRPSARGRIIPSHAEAVRLQSDEQWRCSCENSPDWIMKLDRDGIIRYVNRPLPGLTVAAMSGTRILDHLDERGRRDMVRCLEWVLAGGRPGRGEFEIRLGDGGTRCFEARVAPVTEADAVTALVVNATDVTDRRRVERELRRSEQRYRSLVEHQPELVCRFLPSGTLTFVNRAYAEYFQRSIVELEGFDFFELIPESDRPAMRAHLAGMGTDNLVATVEHKIVTADGALRWQQWTDRAILDEHGVVVEFQSIGRDITPRKRAEEELESYHRLVTSIHDSLLKFVSNATPAQVFDGLLTTICALTESEYGFIGEVLRGPDGSPYLQTRAITNIAWSDETRRFYEENAPSGMEFRNLDTLFGAAMTTGRTVVANDAPNHPQAGGLPPGHPPLRSFLGVPLHSNGELVGLAGIANRPGGYTDEIVEYLQAFRTTCGAVIRAYRMESERNRAVEELEARSETERLLFQELDHRVRNNLASLLGLIDLSSATAADVDEFAASIRGRIEAISHVYTMLSAAHLRPLRLSDMLRAMAPPECRGAIHVRAPDLLVPPQQATALGMVLHELLTNSVKHGSLGSEQGKVRVEWSQMEGQGRRFPRWTWRESGGPIIEIKPPRGVGTGLLEGLIRSDLQGRADLSYPRDGASHRFFVQLDPVGSSSTAP